MHAQDRWCPDFGQISRKSGLALVRIDADHHDQELDAIGFAARA
jgi:hypothetical protein